MVDTEAVEDEEDTGEGDGGGEDLGDGAEGDHFGLRRNVSWIQRTAAVVGVKITHLIASKRLVFSMLLCVCVIIQN